MPKDCTAKCFRCRKEDDHRNMINEGAAVGFQCIKCYISFGRKKTAAPAPAPAPVMEMPTDKPEPIKSPIKEPVTPKKKK